jgi:hypothetical protein
VHGEPPVDRTIMGFDGVLLSPNVALVTYRVCRTESTGDVICSLRSSIWELSAIGWRVRFHQGTPIKNPSPP